MAIKCNICDKELDAFSGGRCRICRTLVCEDCIASGGTDKKGGIVCKKCRAAEKKAEKEENTTESAESAEEKQINTVSRKKTGMIIVASFTLLLVFAYILLIPFITTRNALRIIEFGPEEELQKAKEELSGLSGGYVIERLEDIVINGNREASIRAVYALGAQPNQRAVLTLKQLQASDNCPPHLRSVIVEALLENERLYKSVEEISNTENTPE